MVSYEEQCFIYVCSLFFSLFTPSPLFPICVLLLFNCSLLPPPFPSLSLHQTLFPLGLVFSFWGVRVESCTVNLQLSRTPWSDRWLLTRSYTTPPATCSKWKKEELNKIQKWPEEIRAKLLFFPHAWVWTLAGTLLSKQTYTFREIILNRRKKRMTLTQGRLPFWI